MSIVLLTQQAINALSLGSLYALLAIGLAVVYSVLGLMNFAYGELITVTAYTMWFLMVRGVSFPAAAAGGVIAAGAVALITEFVAFRPFRKASFVVVLIASFATSVIIQNLVRQLVSPRPRGIRVPAVFDEVVRLGPLHVGVLSIVTLLLSLLAMTLLVAFLQRTRMGVALRAAAADFEVARLVGVRPNRVISSAFLTSGILAGIAGVLWVSRSGGMTPTMGLTPVIIAFVSIVMGGLGSLRGAVVGGFVLAFLEIFLQALLPTWALPFVVAFSLAIVVAILYFRPKGLVLKQVAS